MNRFRGAGFLAAGLLAALTFGCSKEVQIGAIVSETGVADLYGGRVRKGIDLALEEINAAGGVNGRKLELISYNDGYEPNKAIDNTKRLLQEDKVFALIGDVGVPTSPIKAKTLSARRLFPTISTAAGRS